MILFIVSIGVTYLLINQIYITGNAFWFKKPMLCFDSDGGLNYSVAGYTGYVGGSRRLDYCANDTLVEGWCSSRGGPTLTSYRCPYGCNNGKCISKANVELNKCSKNSFKFAFLLLGRNQSDISPGKIDKLNKIKSEFGKAFSKATNNLATADVSYPVVTIIDNGSLMNPEKTEFFRDGIAKKFLESNPDKFDFIIAFTAFTSSPSMMDGMIVDYDVYGIGVDASVDYINQLEKDRGVKYGDIKTSTLKSIVYWSPIENLDSPYYNTDYNRISFSNGLLHEVGHHWCCYIGDNFAKGQGNPRLEIKMQGIHFYRGLQSPSETGDPMGSDNWVPNGDGSYRRENKEGINEYHPLQLYFMGLLNKDNYDFNKKFKVYNAGVVGEDFNDQKAYPYKEVSINDIIAVEGERKCRV